jgi:carboxyl-terminal processing protease
MEIKFRGENKSYSFWIIIGLVSVFTFGFKPVDSDYFFKINKSIDIYGQVYKEIALNYVDEIQPEKFMEAGIDGMLSALDPYTNFINESEGDEVELITYGKYGGIGVTIGLRDGYITIISLMDGYSAQRQGIQPGDRILEVDGKSVTGLKPEGVRPLTRGEPGSEVRLKISRDGEAKPLDFVLVRQEIQLKNITYADFVGDGIAYIRLERFSRGAGDELRLAIKDLKLRGTIKSVILDLRDNPGGLLDVAVDIVGKFVKKGNLVVSTRGRKPESEKKFFATEEPMLPEASLIILTNRNSASASEIVAGAIQDLDRGIILGTRTFGKGLVQNIVPLVYNAQLKITTAKYYTPSGRCIQEIDYMHKNNDGVLATTPDSLRREFKTVKGRTVYELGGIHPDTTVELPEESALEKELLRKSMYFKFATRYASLHKELPQNYSNTSLLAEFRQYLEEQKFSYEEETEKKLRELRDAASKLKCDSSVFQEIDGLSKKLSHDKSNNIEQHKNEVLQPLLAELVSMYKGERGGIEATVPVDLQLQAAIGLLTNEKEYSKRLSLQTAKK